MIPGDRLRAVHGALVGGFDLAGLDQLATLHLGVALEQVAGRGCDLEGSALALVHWARKRGQMGALVSGMLVENPTSSAVQAVALAGWAEGDSDSGRGSAREGDGMLDFQAREGTDNLSYTVGTLVGAVRRVDGRLEEQHTALADMQRTIRVQTWAIAVLVATNVGTGLALYAHAMGWWG